MTTRSYLENKVFADVRIAMRKLLDHIQDSGELERYWTIVEKENEEARKAARRLEKERRRLEMGSDFEMSEDENEKEQLRGGKKNVYDSDEEYDSEDDSDKKVVSRFNAGNDDDEAYQLPFNAVRFLGLALKELGKAKRSESAKRLPDDVLAGLLLK